MVSATYVPNVGGYTTAGQNDWVCPYDGYVLYEGVGAGGGGKGGAVSGASGGGGGGEYCFSVIPVYAGYRYRLLRGAAGSGTAYGGANAGDGGDSEFQRVSSDGSTVLEVLARAKGGKGSAGSTGVGGAGGTGGIGDTLIAGSAGQNRPVIGTGGNGGAGAGPFGGAGGFGGNNTGNVGLAATAGNPSGGGGGGGRSTSGTGAGANGAPGFGRLQYYVTYGSVKDSAGDVKSIVSVYYKTGGLLKKVTPVYKNASAALEQLVEMTALPPDWTPPVPSYVPAAHTAKYDVETGGFNINNTTAGRFKSSVQNANSQLSRHLFYGDSVAEGWTSLSGITATADRVNAFPLKYRDKVCSVMSKQVAGTGIVRAYSVTLVTAKYKDPRWQKTDAPPWFPEGHYVRTTSTSVPAIFTSNLPGTIVQMLYLDTSANIRITIDGVAQTIVGGGTGLPKLFTQTGLSNATHTVTVAPVTAGQEIRIGGVSVHKTTGLLVDNVAQGGSRLAGAAGQPCWGDISSGYDNMLPFYSHAQSLRDDHVLFIELGGNDMAQGNSLSDMLTETTQLAAAHPNSDIVILPPAKGGTGFDGPNYETYWTNVMNACVTNNWCYIDMQYLLGGYANMVAQGWTSDAYGHLNVAGATYLGEACATAMLKGTGLI